jgi:two-component system copper resistance phosphate regulon response regulator CusR
MVILVVEDDFQQAALIKAILEEEEYVVDQAFDGQEGLRKIEVRDYDLAVIDLDLPQVTGEELVRRIRELGLATPVIILTANDEVGSKVGLLDIGADDYLTKPFAVDELIARTRAILRRPPPVVSSTLKMGDLEMRYGTHEVYVNTTLTLNRLN